LGVLLLFMLLLSEEFEVVRDAWVGPSSCPENDYERAYGWKGNTIHESKMALFFECMQ